jgi:acetamidase/formamidase
MRRGAFPDGRARGSPVWSASRRSVRSEREFMSITIPASPKSIQWGFLDAAVPPIATVPSGSEIVIETVTAERHQVPKDSIYEILPEHLPILDQVVRGPGPHLLTGPIYVEGAMPGDVLALEILDVQLRQNWGFTIILPLLGTLPEDFPDPELVHILLDKEAGVGHLPWGGQLKLNPFFGIMGVAPPPVWGRVSSIVPRTFGGNLDNKDLLPGTTIYFPVFNPGAMLTVGDGHGAQGDGEVCITAIETALTGKFRVTVRKDMRLKMPRAESATHFMTMGFDEDLDDALKMALRDMIVWVHELTGLTRGQAYMLCSLAADMHVTQTVNVAKGVHCMLPKSVLPRK